MNRESPNSDEHNPTNSQQSNHHEYEIDSRNNMRDMIFLVEDDIVEDDPEDLNYVPSPNDSDESDTMSLASEPDFIEVLNGVIRSNENPLHEDIISEEENYSDNSNVNLAESTEVIEQQSTGNSSKKNKSPREEGELTSSTSTLSLEN